MKSMKEKMMKPKRPEVVLSSKSKMSDMKYKKVKSDMMKRM